MPHMIEFKKTHKETSKDRNRDRKSMHMCTNMQILPAKLHFSCLLANLFL